MALDRKTGKRVWTGKRGKSRIAHATPIIYREAGEECLLSIAGDVIQSFNPATGERLWSAFAQGEGLVPSPVVGNGLIFAASGYEKTTLRAIRAGGRGDVSTTHIVWEQNKGVPTQPSLLYVEPRLYGLSDGGIVSCYEPASGEVLWQERIGGNYSASPVFGDGRIYIVSEAGETTVLRADGQFEIIARNSLNTKCQASPAISQGQIFLRTESSLFCVGRR